MSSGSDAVGTLANEIYAVSLNWFPGLVNLTFSIIGILYILLLF